jgi:hypothetical protein
VTILLVACGCGDDGARVLFNQAVAAIRGGDLVTAEIAAEKAAARGGALFEARRDFVLGCAAFLRAEREEIKIYGPQGAKAVDAAITHVERALAFWQSASAGETDWPEARRNAERALLELSELRSKKDELGKDPQKAPKPKPQPASEDPAASPQDPGVDKRPAPRPDPQVSELSPEQIARVLERLSEKEKEKIRLRRAEQQARRASVERDW